MRLATALTVLIFALVLGVRAAEQTSRVAPARRSPALPPILQTCPMHPDIVEDKPGTCPLCRMRLVPVRLESVWSCPLHAAITKSAPGTCPICKRELVQMTMALTWTCRSRPDIDVIEPTRCPDGSAMIPKRTLRPHGNHNPQHGGQFFMAPDNTHHLEGTLPTSRVFRLYLYDDYARPLAASRLKAVEGRVEIGERSIRMTASTAGSYLQGRIEPPRFPARVTAKVKLTPNTPEYRFDFTFAIPTKDPAAPASSRPRSAKAATVSSSPAQSQIANVDSQPQIDPALIQVPIPATVSEILPQIQLRDRQVGELLNRGNLPAVFVPAFQARDLAVALEARVGSLVPAKRDAAEDAIQDLVRTAWLLDAFGDVGNAEQAKTVYTSFHDAVLRIVQVFAGVR